MTTLTLRELLDEFWREKRRPYTINQLVVDTGLARETVVKILDGDYETSNMATVQRALAPFGYKAEISLKPLNGKVAPEASLPVTAFDQAEQTTGRP